MGMKFQVIFLIGDDFFANFSSCVVGPTVIVIDGQMDAVLEIQGFWEFMGQKLHKSKGTSGGTRV